MKILMLMISCFILSAGIVFAENASDDAQKNDKANNTTSPSKYKSSPQLRYHSDKPAEESNALGTLKPMLDQVMGNNPNNSTGGAEIPGGAKYNF